MKQTYNILAVFILAYAALLVPSTASAFGEKDAERAAEYLARSQIRTVYKNMVEKKGISWEKVKTEILPKMMRNAAKRLSKYDDRIARKHFVPVYFESMFDEIAKLNQRYQNNRQKACIIPDTFEISKKYFLKEVKVQINLGFLRINFKLLKKEVAKVSVKLRRRRIICCPPRWWGGGWRVCN